MRGEGQRRPGLGLVLLLLLLLHPAQAARGYYYGDYYYYDDSSAQTAAPQPGAPAHCLLVDSKGATRASECTNCACEPCGGEDIRLNGYLNCACTQPPSWCALLDLGCLFQCKCAGGYGLLRSDRIRPLGQGWMGGEVEVAAIGT